MVGLSSQPILWEGKLCNTLLFMYYFSQPLYRVIIHSLIIIDWSLIRANSKCRTSNGRASFQSQIKLERNILLVKVHKTTRNVTLTPWYLEEWVYWSLALLPLHPDVLSSISPWRRKVVMAFESEKNLTREIFLPAKLFVSYIFNNKKVASIDRYSN